MARAQRRRRDPYNRAVAAMRGRPLSSLSPDEREILRADAARRAEVIAQEEAAAIARSHSAFASTEEMEKELARMYRKVANELKMYVSGVYAQVQMNGGEWTLQDMGKFGRAENLFRQINEQLRAMGRRQVSFFNKKLGDMYKDSLLRTLWEFGGGKVTMNLNRLNPAWIQEAISYPWSGSMFSERIWDNVDDLANRLRTGLTQSMVLGESVGDTAKRITAGMDVAEFNATRLARTEGMRVAYVGQRHAYEDSKLGEVKYVATIPSERTCPKCKGHHGQLFKLGAELPLPLHPQCRCTYAPVVDVDALPDGFLNDAVGSVEGKKNYEKWRSKQEAAAEKQAEKVGT